MNLFKRIFHRHKFVKDLGTVQSMGYLRGYLILGVTSKCECGKTKFEKLEL